jgi:TctA family transporter
MLVLLSRPLMSLWITFLQVPYRYIFPTLTVLGCIGIYSLNQNAFEVWLAVGAAALGYVFYKLGCELVPFLLGFIAGPGIEQHLRLALMSSHGDWGVLLSRPISGALLGAAALMIVVAMLPSIKRLREQVFQSAR